MHQLFIHFKKAYDSVRREVLYNILIEFGIRMKLVRLIKMCLTEIYSNDGIGVRLPEMARDSTPLRGIQAISGVDPACY